MDVSLMTKKTKSGKNPKFESSQLFEQILFVETPPPHTHTQTHTGTETTFASQFHLAINKTGISIDLIHIHTVYGKNAKTYSECE